MRVLHWCAMGASLHWWSDAHRGQSANVYLQAQLIEGCHKKWKSVGLHVNTKKSVVSIIGLDVLKKISIYPRDVCRNGVSKNSIECSRCKLWVHKRCSGITVQSADPNYVCSRYRGKSGPIDDRPGACPTKEISIEFQIRSRQICLYLFHIYPITKRFCKFTGTVETICLSQVNYWFNIRLLFSFKPCRSFTESYIHHNPIKSVTLIMMIWTICNNHMWVDNLILSTNILLQHVCWNRDVFAPRKTYPHPPWMFPNRWVI